MRLNSYIAYSGVCSRRKADVLIQAGKVKVGGVVVTELGRQVRGDESVCVEDRIISPLQKIYIILHKPKGVTTTREDRFAAKKVTDIIPLQFRQLFPVGRLDRDSEGLLIITNDGSLCHQVTHPRFGIAKEYRITIQGVFKKGDAARARQGVRCGADFLKVERIRVDAVSDTTTVLQVVVREGKKRHLRRLLARMGYSVISLVRIRIGSLALGTLRPGEYRQLKREAIYDALGIAGGRT